VNVTFFLQVILIINKGGVTSCTVNAPLFFLLCVDENDFPFTRPLPTDCQRVGPRFNRSHAEDVGRWVKDPTLVHRMF